MTFNSITLESGGGSRPELDFIALVSNNRPISRLPHTREDSAELVKVLMGAWQLLPSLSDERMAELRATLLEQDFRQLSMARLAIIAFSKAQVVATNELIRALAETKLDYSLLKGSATARIAYPEPYMRGAWDLDVGVPPAALAQAEAIAVACGYSAAQQDPQTSEFYLADPKLKAKVESEHYELGFLVRRLQVTNLSSTTLEALRSGEFARNYWFDVESDAPYCFASVDIHHAMSHDIPLDGLLAETRTVRAGALDVRVPSTAWLLFHLIFKVYWEGVHNYRKGLYEYADLVRLMRTADVGVTERLKQLLSHYNLLAAGHYVLRRLPQFGMPLDAHVRQFIADTGTPPVEASDPIRLNDYGDMWPKMWGRR